MPDRLNWGYTIFTGLFKGKSVREWSTLRSGYEDVYLNNVVAYVNDTDTLFSKHIKFDVKEIETILDELLHEVQSDAGIQDNVIWCEYFGQRTENLSKTLEDHILRPQLL